MHFFRHSVKSLISLYSLFPSLSHSYICAHYITIITEDREEGDRDGVSGVLVLEVLEEAENRVGRGAREKPRGYAGGAELKKKVQMLFPAVLVLHLLVGRILAGSALALPPAVAFGVGG